MSRHQRGAVSIEYVGVTAFVTLLVAALLNTGLPGRITAAVRSAVCSVLGECVATGGGIPGSGSSAGSGLPGTNVDGDGLTETEELDVGSPEADTDGDGAGDLEELEGGTSPTVAGDPAAGWEQGSIGGRPLPDLDEAAPREVAEFFAGLTDAEKAELARTYPEIVGPLAGAPFDVRYEANRILMERALPGLRAVRDQLAVRVEDARAEVERWGWVPGYGDVLRDRVRRLENQLDLARAKVELTEQWAASGRQFLLYDPTGKGKVAEVIGDLGTAEDVAVFVPGMANDISDFEDIRLRGVDFQQTAIDKHGASHVASVVWLGYDTPIDPRDDPAEVFDTVGSGPARDGGADLPPFVEGLLAEADRHVTVVSHSYGTIVAGYALRNGLEAEDVIFLGSPGVDADTAADLGSGYVAWAAQAPDDPIDKVPNVRVGGLGHGRDPTDPGFGALVFDTGDAEGHSNYFKLNTESMYNIARIVLGEYDAVTLCEEVGCPGYP